MPKLKIATAPERTTILVVDDMQAMRQIIKSTLVPMGFKRFLESTNGAEAIKQLQQTKIDLIICDWDMPEMNGLSLLKKIRADKKLQHVPFIMITAHASASLIRECIVNGIDGYIVKPFQPMSLCHKVNSLLAEPVKLSA